MDLVGVRIEGLALILSIAAFGAAILGPIITNMFAVFIGKAERKKHTENENRKRRIDYLKAVLVELTDARSQLGDTRSLSGLQLSRAAAQLLAVGDDLCTDLGRQVLKGPSHERLAAINDGIVRIGELLAAVNRGDDW